MNVNDGYRRCLHTTSSVANGPSKCSSYPPLHHTYNTEKKKKTSHTQVQGAAYVRSSTTRSSCHMRTSLRVELTVVEDECHDNLCSTTQQCQENVASRKYYHNEVQASRRRNDLINSPTTSLRAFGQPFRHPPSTSTHTRRRRSYTK